MAMKGEVKAAAEFWTTELKAGIVNSNSKQFNEIKIIDMWHDSLVKQMTSRYSGHWYSEDPARGSGYRCVSFDTRIDPVLRQAAVDAGFEVNLEKWLAHTRGTIMYVNPGSVVVSNARGLALKGNSGAPSGSSSSSSQTNRQVLFGK
jgi:hypothetical protein